MSETWNWLTKYLEFNLVSKFYANKYLASNSTLNSRLKEVELYRQCYFKRISLKKLQSRKEGKNCTMWEITKHSFGCIHGHRWREESVNNVTRSLLANTAHYQFLLRITSIDYPTWLLNNFCSIKIFWLQFEIHRLVV